METRQKDLQEAGWLRAIPLPEGIQLPKKVKKVGDRWFFEDTTNQLWSLIFAPKEDPLRLQRAQVAEAYAEKAGFTSLPDRYYGRLDFESGEPTRSWLLQRESVKNPLRCWLKQTDDREQLAEVGEKLGRALQAFQAQRLPLSLSGGWAEDLQTDIDYLLYRHGLLSNKMRKEYVLIDFISQTRHLLDILPERNVLFDCSLERLQVLADGAIGLDDWSWVCRGDGVYDLVFLNDAAEYSEEFCRAVLRGYSGGKTARMTFRLLSLYTAIYTLKRLVDVATGEARYLNLEETIRYVESIIAHFQDFTHCKPDWA